MLDNDIREAVVKAIKVLDAIEFTGYGGAYCPVCNEQIPTGPSPIAPIKCAACTFWCDRMLSDIAAQQGGVPNWFSIRYNGEHFTIDERNEEGPIMTVRYFDDTKVVTTRLRQQGPVPVWARPKLQDNATITEGNPLNLPIGISRP